MFDKYFVTQNLLQNVHSYFNWPSLNAPWEQLMEIGQMWRMGKLGKTGQTVQKWAATITRKKMGLGRRGEIYYKRRFLGLAKICICLSFRPQFCGLQKYFYQIWSLHQARQNFTLAMWQLTEVMATLTMATDFIFLKLHNTEHILLILLFPVHLKISVHPKRISVYPKHFSSPKKFQDHNILNKAEWHEEISSLVLQWVSIFFSLTFSIYSQVRP